MTTTDTALCLLCDDRGRTTPSDTGRTCPTCRAWLTHTITAIGELAAQAAAWIDPRPGTTTGAIAYGSRPPINVDAVDPELALLELNPGDPTSAVPILDALEMWEREIRELQHLAPYGPVSHYRTLATGNRLNDTGWTLTACLRFLTAQVDWMSRCEDFDLVTFADHARRSAATLRRWSEDDRQIGTRIACPAMLEDGSSCGRSLRVSSDGAPVVCRGCGTSWSIEWLIRVAGEDADGWADMEAVVRLSGLHESTIRRWARSGKVRKRGLLYSVRDISTMAERHLVTA
jgi:hypothetical protein